MHTITKVEIITGHWISSHVCLCPTAELPHLLLTPTHINIHTYNTLNFLFYGLGSVKHFLRGPANQWAHRTKVCVISLIYSSTHTHIRTLSRPGRWRVTEQSMQLIVFIFLLGLLAWQPGTFPTSSPHISPFRPYICFSQLHSHPCPLVKKNKNLCLLPCCSFTEPSECHLTTITSGFSAHWAE